MKRRVFLKGGLATSTLAIAMGAGLIAPRVLLAAWPKDAFEAKNVQDALKNLYGGDLTEPSDKISIKVPEIAENGGQVPVTVSSTLDKVQTISIIVEKNGTPLAASFHLTDASLPTISTRIKMGQTSNVIAAVKAGDGKVYSARKEVKVTIGGCGG